MAKAKVAGVLAILVVLLMNANGLRAGDIVGALSVPKPDQAVVFVDQVPGTFHGEQAKMDQRGKLFVPYVLPIVQGSSVEFHNSDNLQHNVFGVGADKFNLGTYSEGASRNFTFNKLGDVAVLCNVHPEMEGHILVLQNPYFATLDASGKFRIANVPPGDYVVKAWYQGKTKQQNVKVSATGSVTVSF